VQPRGPEDLGVKKAKRAVTAIMADMAKKANAVKEDTEANVAKWAQ